jgi:hypothetical protein
MATKGFSYFTRPGNNPNERIESFDQNPNIKLKKYNGTSTGWPTLSKIQGDGQSHTEQQRDLFKTQQNITDFFKSNY